MSAWPVRLHRFSRIAAAAVALTCLSACGSSDRPAAPPAPPPPPPARLVSRIQTLRAEGGRLDWSHRRDTIVFDRRGGDGFYDVYTMTPAGSDERCLTCDKAALPNRHIGNPAWHPSGDWIVFQAQNRAAGDDDVATPGAGLRNDVWLMDSEGQRFFQFTTVDPRGGGVLHPHFSNSGNRLLWAERIGPGEPGNQYGVWALKLADFRVVGGTPRLENVTTMRPGEQQVFYESHGFSADDRRIIFSGNLSRGQDELGIDIYLLDLETNALTNLTNSPDAWDEHAHFSPGGGKIVWMSSTGQRSPLHTDYWMMNPDGSGKERITFFNDPTSSDFIPGGVTSADSAWNASGTRIAAYVIEGQGDRTGRIVMLELSRAIFQQPPGEEQEEVVESKPSVPPPASLPLPAVGQPGAQAPAMVSAITIAPRTLSELRNWDAEIDRLHRRGELARIESLADPLVPGRLHERFAQLHRGVRVFGGDVTRQTADGQTVSLFGMLYAGIDIDVAPAFTAHHVRAEIERTPDTRLSAGREAELVVLPLGGRASLAYLARLVSPADLTVTFIDARSGQLVDSYSDVQADRAATGAQSASAGVPAHGQRSHEYNMGGDARRTLDILSGAVAASGQPEDAGTRQSHVRLTHDFLLERFRRPGLAQDVPVVSLSGVLRPESASRHAFPLFSRPAFYAGSGVVIYDDGASAARAPGTPGPSSALDVVAHELAHGVIEYSSKLIYRGESGALNEAFADIMATAVEFASQPAGSGPQHADYLIGEDAAPSSALRSLQQPAAYYQADHYDRRFVGGADNGGVHVNAGIASHAFYLAVEGGTHAVSDIAVAGVGSARRADVERVFYRAFAFLLPSNATFALARVATLQAAWDLFGDDPALCRALTEAWTAVGVP